MPDLTFAKINYAKDLFFWMYGVVIVTDLQIPAMLKLINYLPPHVTGIHAFGDVSKNEYEDALTPLLDQQLALNKKLNFILILETEIKNFEPGMWCGTMRVGVKYFFKWNKIAVVSDWKSVQGYSDLFKFIIPGKYESFKLDQLDLALKWVASRV